MAAHRHLDAAGLEDLVLLNGHKAQKRFLLDALGLCPECARVGEHLLAAREAGWLPEDYGILEAELARSGFEAPALWEKLARYSPEKRRGLIQDTDRFLSWGLCELCSAAKAGKPRQEMQFKRWSSPSWRFSWQTGCPPNRPFEPEWLSELQALARAYLGNARRVLGELRSAEEAFSRADELWTKGEVEVGDPLGYGPVILDLEASLFRDQRRFPRGEDGRDEGARREMLPVFQSRDVHREALAALAVFQQAAAREAAGAELVGRVAAFLDRARHDPGLRFDA